VHISSKYYRNILLSKFVEVFKKQSRIINERNKLLNYLKLRGNFNFNKSNKYQFFSHKNHKFLITHSFRI
jgi:hypothetical protein